MDFLVIVLIIMISQKYWISHRINFSYLIISWIQKEKVIYFFIIICYFLKRNFKLNHQILKVRTILETALLACSLNLDADYFGIVFVAFFIFFFLLKLDYFYGSSFTHTHCLVENLIVTTFVSIFHKNVYTTATIVKSSKKI